MTEVIRLKTIARDLRKVGEGGSCEIVGTIEEKMEDHSILTRKSGQRLIG